MENGDFVIAGVKFAPANYILLSGTALIIVGMCMVIYIALFVGNQDSEANSTEESTQLKADSVDGKACYISLDYYVYTSLVS